jgi:hypothetical protein
MGNEAHFAPDELSDRRLSYLTLSVAYLKGGSPPVEFQM